MKFYPHHIGDFDRATRHLTRLERSLYRDLIELYYDTEKPLSLEVAFVCRRIIANECSTDVQRLLNEFFNETPQGWYHSRCEYEIEKYRANASQKSEAGKASAAKREWKRQQAMNGRSTGVENPFNGTPTNQEPITNNHEPIIKTASRKTKLPEDFYPDETGIKKATDAKITVSAELERFTDFHKSKGTLMLDWQAAWRTWVSNAVKFARKPTLSEREEKKRQEWTEKMFPDRAERVVNG